MSRCVRVSEGQCALCNRAQRGPPVRGSQSQDRRAEGRRTRSLAACARRALAAAHTRRRWLLAGPRSHACRRQMWGPPAPTSREPCLVTVSVSLLVPFLWRPQTTTGPNTATHSRTAAWPSPKPMPTGQTLRGIPRWPGCPMQPVPSPGALQWAGRPRVLQEGEPRAGEGDGVGGAWLRGPFTQLHWHPLGVPTLPLGLLRSLPTTRASS